MTKTICNMCGEEFDCCDDFSIRHTFGYGSVHDMDKLEVDLCNECLDELTTYLVENCKHNPIVETCYGGQ